MNYRKRLLSILLFTAFILFGISCSKKAANVVAQPMPIDKLKDVAVWITKPDQSLKLGKLELTSETGKINNQFPVITIDPGVTYQPVDGFGFTLTGGSAYLLNKMPSGARSNLLNELLFIY